LPGKWSKVRVCVINREHLAIVEEYFGPDEKITCEQLQALGIRHGHLSKGAADDLSAILCTRMTRDKDGKETFHHERETSYIGKGKRVIVYERSRYWRKAFSGPFEVMQLVYGGASF
jgi:hypothetical protein